MIKILHREFILPATLAIMACEGVCAYEKAPKTVLISQVVEHPALDRTTQGIMEGLEQNGYKQGINLTIRVESAQANPALAAQIAAKFVNQLPDVVVGVGTLSAQSLAKYAREKRVKLVFSSVTDPLGAGLVNTLENPGNNTSGVSNFVALEPQLQLFQKLQPTLKRLGILYNPSELNSVSIVNQLKELCPKFGLTLVPQAVLKTADMAQAATKLAGNVEAIFISNDNTALAALQSILMAATKQKIPVYVSDTDAVKLGALAALGPNQYAVGIQTGAGIARILKGKDVNTTPVEFPTQMELYLNEATAQALGIPLPEALKASATQVIQKEAP